MLTGQVRDHLLYLFQLMNKVCLIVMGMSTNKLERNEILFRRMCKTVNRN